MKNSETNPKASQIKRVNDPVKIKGALLTRDILSALILVVLLYTSSSKLLDYPAFKSVLIMSPLLRPFATVIALVLPLLEIAIVVLLFFPKTKLVGLYAAFLLIGIFTIYITYMVVYTPHLPCSCGGVISNLSWKQHIIFNLLLLVITWTAILFHKRSTNLISDLPP